MQNVHNDAKWVRLDELNEQVWVPADILVVDLEEDVVVNSYGVYERKNGRLYLPLDHVNDMRTQVEALGLQVK